MIVKFWNRHIKGKYNPRNGYIMRGKNNRDITLRGLREVYFKPRKGLRHALRRSRS